MTLIDILMYVLCAIGGLVVLGVVFTLLKGKKQPINTLYLKRYPDGTKSFRLGLRVNLEALEPGDKFEVVVQEERPTETDISIYRNVKED